MRTFAAFISLALGILASANLQAQSPQANDATRDLSYQNPITKKEYTVSVTSTVPDQLYGEYRGDIGYIELRGDGSGVFKYNIASPFFDCPLGFEESEIAITWGIEVGEQGQLALDGQFMRLHLVSTDNKSLGCIGSWMDDNYTMLHMARRDDGNIVIVCPEGSMASPWEKSTVF